MKNIFMTIGFILLISIQVYGQEFSRHQIGIRFSDGTTMALNSSLGGAGMSGLIGGLFKSATTYETKSAGNFGVQYHYQISKRFQFGLDLSYQNVDNKVVFKSQNKSGELIFEERRNLFVVMPTASFSYVKSKWLDFYGSASLGAIIGSSKRMGGTTYDLLSEKDGKTDFSLAFQINPVGLRVGKDFGGFVHLGYGHLGILSLGVNYRIL